MADKTYAEYIAALSAVTTEPNSTDELYIKQGSVSKKIAIDKLMLSVPEQTLSLTPFDNVIYGPHASDATKITIAAGGQFTLADGTVKEFASATDLDIDSDLTTDDTLAAKFYYLWSNGVVTKFSDSAAAAPSDVSGGVKLRGGVLVYDDSGTKKVVDFAFDGVFYRYWGKQQGASGDLTGAYSGSLGLTWQDVDCSDVIPAGVTTALVLAVLSVQAYHLIRRKGETVVGNYTRAHFDSAQLQAQYLTTLDEDGVYQASNHTSITTNINVLGFWVRK